jgi:phosphoenolpyruvate carboxykinase (ATP)
MWETGPRNRNYGADRFGFRDLATVNWNPIEPTLYEHALARSEASIAAGGALRAETGKHTGRSPKDKYIVEDSRTAKSVWWENNGKISPQQFKRLHEDFIEFARGKELFVQDLHAGASQVHCLTTRVFTELAWHSLFIRALLIRPAREDLAHFVPRLTIACFPGFKADPERHGTRSETVIAIDFSKQIILIGGTSYAGEIKKAVFTALNFMLPSAAVMPMHCSANVGVGGDAAVFFGLSGTGKTTLSADPDRILIGDDEHGWGSDGVFNFEGGCYAKAIKLNAEAEPAIFAATQQFGTVLENVIFDADTRVCDFDDASLTENTRAAYPLHFIKNASNTGRTGHPKNIIMLTADAFGVMPPIAKLTPAQAMYHFLSGYTAKVAGTEKGIIEPEATFSTCFGAPFMPLHPSVYGQLLRELIAEHKVDCWLVNTGWTGGKYGVGQRMPIKVTRALLTAALDGSLKKGSFRTDPYFGFEVPNHADQVDPSLLNPRDTWTRPDEYDVIANRLVQMFRKNFQAFEAFVDASVKAAGPPAQAVPQPCEKARIAAS